MCLGGNRAKITKPDYSAYDQQFQLQKQAIDSAMNSGTLQMQEQLNASLRNQTAAREEIRDAKVDAANDARRLNEEAMRLSTLMGTPPPEKTAQSPDIGARDRGLNTRRGKGSLRIGRTAKGNAQGAGLNIT